jgi:hypothetical protein
MAGSYHKCTFDRDIPRPGLPSGIPRQTGKADETGDAGILKYMCTIERHKRYLTISFLTGRG